MKPLSTPERQSYLILEAKKLHTACRQAQKHTSPIHWHSFPGLFSDSTWLIMLHPTPSLITFYCSMWYHSHVAIWLEHHHRGTWNKNWIGHWPDYFFPCRKIAWGWDKHNQQAILAVYTCKSVNKVMESMVWFWYRFIYTPFCFPRLHNSALIPEILFLLSPLNLLTPSYPPPNHQPFILCFRLPPPFTNPLLYTATQCWCWWWLRLGSTQPSFGDGGKQTRWLSSHCRASWHWVHCW